MRFLRHALALGALTMLASMAQAQTYRDTSGTVPQPVVPLVGCSPGGSCSGPVSATNPMPISGSFSATISGFAPGSAYATPLSVSTTSARVALPTGTVVVVYNTGANAAYVQLGNSSVTATTSNDVIQPGSWMAFTVGANTNLAAITSSGATSLNISGGSGLPTGAGGGGSSSGGGTVTQGTAASAAGAWPTYLTQGGSALSASNGIFVNPATGATFAISGSVTLGAGSNTIGNVGGLGTAGTPSGGVVSVQGVAGGVAQPVSQSAGPWTENQTQLGGATLGAATAWGTAPSGNVQGVNADILGPLGSSTADGAAGTTSLSGAGGPGGAYCRASFTGVGGTLTITIPASSGAGVAGSNTTVTGTGVSGMSAQGGGGSNGGTAGQVSSTSSCTASGAVKVAGAGSRSVTSVNSGATGGGAGGTESSNAGVSGGAPGAVNTTTGDGGGSGGGGANAHNGVTVASASGSNGGAGFGGTGAGSGSTNSSTVGGAGTQPGAAGGGGYGNGTTLATNGGAGAAGTDWDGTHGAGGAGGGGGAAASGTGGSGGSGGDCGAGAGGGGITSSGTTPAGTPGKGCVLISWP